MMAFLKKVFGNTRPPMNEASQHMLLAYAVFGFFAAGQTRSNFHPQTFHFTPESQNAHWSFPAGDNSELRWCLEYAYRQPGPLISIYDPIIDEHIGYLINNNIDEFFASKPSPARGAPTTPAIEPAPDFLWQGHFFWTEQGQDRAYGFEIVGTQAAGRVGQSAIRFVLVSQINQTPAAFFEQLCRVCKDPILDGDIPFAQFIELERPRIIERVTSGDPSALRRYATALKALLAQSG